MNIEAYYTSADFHPGETEGEYEARICRQIEATATRPMTARVIYGCDSFLAPMPGRKFEGAQNAYRQGMRRAIRGIVKERLETTEMLWVEFKMSRDPSQHQAGVQIWLEKGTVDLTDVLRPHMDQIIGAAERAAFREMAATF